MIDAYRPFAFLLAKLSPILKEEDSQMQHYLKQAIVTAVIVAVIFRVAAVRKAVTGMA